MTILDSPTLAYNLTLPTADHNTNSPPLSPLSSSPSLLSLDTNIPQDTIYFPSNNMNLNRYNPLNDMPVLGEKKAPKKFTGKYSEVTQFIKHYSRLLEQYQVEDEVSKCEGILEYCSKSVKRFIESSTHFKTPNWNRLKADILKYYDAEKEEMKYNLPDLLQFLQESASRRMNNIEKWKQYYREYISHAGHLLSMNQLTEQDYHGYFWLGIPIGLRDLLEDRLYARHPDHDTRSPWPIDHITAIVDSHFKRGKYGDRLVLPTRFTQADDTDYPNSDSESEGTDSDSDSEYERRHCSKSSKKKRKAKKSTDSKKPATQQLEEDRTRVIKAPQEELEGIISKLNTMSIDDPTYGALYFKALSTDTTGLVARCILRAPKQEETHAVYTAATGTPAVRPPPIMPSAPINYQPPAVYSPAQPTAPYTSTRPPLSYPNNIPMGSQALLKPVPPPGRVPNICYGCNDPNHMMRECPGMVDLLNKGIL